MKNTKAIAILFAFLAAVAYAISIPASKVLLTHVGPTYMAAFLYLGAGVGIGVLFVISRNRGREIVLLSRGDLPYVIGMIALDIIAPILLMIGISEGTSSNASLLSNFEIVATTVIALCIFKETVTRKLWIAVALITLSSVILSFGGAGSFDFSYGSLFVLAATVCWGFENNCTRMISSKSTYEIVTVKGLGSGLGAMVIAFAIGERFPEFSYIAVIMLLGFVAFGLSIFMYVRAQNVLGAAKTSAYYAVAPFVGAFLSFVFLRESLTFSYAVALVIMIAGAVLVVSDTLIRNHSHAHCHTFVHTHDGTTHEHTILHDHDHNHYVSDSQHGHKHKVKELEKEITFKTTETQARQGLLK